ncbi:hypothetical protein [Bernardetia sp.]|uniref:hypothetical protein n=1 Tax=Bernardetia sp. TaxID=1937974 RepID=UPI0025BFCB22|nr:hypothetical protein [Bernardetia sp.]
MKIFFVIYCLSFFIHLSFAQDIRKGDNIQMIRKMLNSKQTKLYYTNDGMDIGSLIIDTTHQTYYAVYRYNGGYEYQDIAFYVSSKNNSWKEIVQDSTLQKGYEIDPKSEVSYSYSCDSSQLIYYVPNYFSAKYTAFVLEEDTVKKVILNQRSMIMCFENDLYYDFQYCGCGGKCYNSTLYKLQENTYQPIYTFEYGCNQYITITNLDNQKSIKLEFNEELYPSKSDIIQPIWRQVLSEEISF